VEWTLPDRSRLTAPKELKLAIQAEIGDIREVLERAVIFKEQLSDIGPFYLMILPKARFLTNGCISCGEDVLEGRIRCLICQDAAWIVLGIPPPNVAMPLG
jgi:hypothetical protein